MTGIWELAAAVALGAAAAALGTPTGVSGGLLILPVLLTAYGLPSTVASATTLVFNVVSTPATVTRHARQSRIDWPLARLLATAATPTAAAGAALNVFVITDPALFQALVATLLAAVATSLFLPRATTRPQPHPHLKRHTVPLAAAAAASGLIGGFYGLGGALLAAPATLLITRRPVTQIAPAALVATLTVSLAGLATYITLDLTGHTTVQTPHWPTALALGTGGILGSHLAAKVAGRVPDRWLRAGLGVFVLVSAVRLWV